MKPTQSSGHKTKTMQSCEGAPGSRDWVTPSQDPQLIHSSLDTETTPTSWHWHQLVTCLLLSMGHNRSCTNILKALESIMMHASWDLGPALCTQTINLAPTTNTQANKPVPLHIPTDQKCFLKFYIWTEITSRNARGLFLAQYMSHLSDSFSPLCIFFY